MTRLTAEQKAKLILRYKFKDPQQLWDSKVADLTRLDFKSDIKVVLEKLIERENAKRPAHYA